MFSTEGGRREGRSGNGPPFFVALRQRKGRLWGGELSFLPLGGRGTMRSMVEGHARCFLPYPRRATPPVPPHHLRRSPPPFRGGSSASGRFLPPPSGTTATPNSPTSAPDARGVRPSPRTSRRRASCARRSSRRTPP